MEKEWSSWLGSPLLPFKKTEMIQEGMVRKINFPVMAMVDALGCAPLNATDQ